MHLDHIFSLRAFLTLHDLKLDVITLLQGLVAFRRDGAVLDEHIGAIIPAVIAKVFESLAQIGRIEYKVIGIPHAA